MINIEHFIENYKDYDEDEIDLSKNDWHIISETFELTEDFMEHFCDKIDFLSISTNQLLSLDFVEKYSDKVYWINGSINNEVIMKAMFSKSKNERYILGNIKL